MQPPSGVFAATNLVGQGTNTLLKWGTIGGETNVVQAASGNFGAATNKFTDISPPIVASGGDPTNASYVAPGGATHSPARYYRVRLLQ